MKRREPLFLSFNLGVNVPLELVLRGIGQAIHRYEVTKDGQFALPLHIMVTDSVEAAANASDMAKIVILLSSTPQTVSENIVVAPHEEVGFEAALYAALCKITVQK